MDVEERNGFHALPRRKPVPHLLESRAGFPLSSTTITAYVSMHYTKAVARAQDTVQLASKEIKFLLAIGPAFGENFLNMVFIFLS